MTTRGVIDELVIRDLGVIADAVLPLGPGFTAVTGETGAGKTMVVTALGLLLGERSDAGAVRAGAAAASVEGRWVVPAAGTVADRVAEAGGVLDAIDGTGFGELVLARSVSAEGRSRASAGGRGAPAAVLAELGEALVVVHGQSDQLRLRSATAQREALDRFAGAEFAAALAGYGEVYARWRAGTAELETLLVERDRRTREADELRASLAEIEAVAPIAGEDAELAERAERLTNLEGLRSAAAEAHEALSAESDAPDALSLADAARRALERGGRHDPALTALAERAAEAGYLLRDLAGDVSSYLAGLDADGAHDLELVHERRATLTALTRKYGPTLEDVLALLSSGSDRLLEIDGDSDRIALLEQQVAADAAAARERAADLTRRRTEAAGLFAEAVTGELAALAMPDARVVVAVEPRAELAEHGADTAQILLRPHPGSEPRPLGRGASGGELSRVMLAIEVVLAASDPVPTFVFDEIDAGVGGAAAIEIGRRLARLAESAQVIVVTHLAQVAAFATNHLTVVKGSDGAVTASSVIRLDGEARVAEMARLLSGLPDSATGLEHARELLSLAQV